jgi:hypothetical protein
MRFWPNEAKKSSEIKGDHAYGEGARLVVLLASQDRGSIVKAMDLGVLGSPAIRV